MANRDDYNTIQLTVWPSGRVDAHTPYHPDFPKRAREIGGSWSKDDRLWVFPVSANAADKVRDLCILCFGTDSGAPTKAIPKRERKARKASRAKGAKGLAAYSADDLLAELRRRGLAVLHQTKQAPQPEPASAPESKAPAASDTAFTL